MQARATALASLERVARLLEGHASNATSMGSQFLPLPPAGSEDPYGHCAAQLHCAFSKPRACDKAQTHTEDAQNLLAAHLRSATSGIHVHAGQKMPAAHRQHSGSLVNKPSHKSMVPQKQTSIDAGAAQHGSISVGRLKGPASGVHVLDARACTQSPGGNLKAHRAEHFQLDILQRDIRLPIGCQHISDATLTEHLHEGSASFVHAHNVQNSPVAAGPTKKVSKPPRCNDTPSGVVPAYRPERAGRLHGLENLQVAKLSSANTISIGTHAPLKHQRCHHPADLYEVEASCLCA